MRRAFRVLAWTALAVIGTAVLLVALVVWAFWPPPIVVPLQVDLALADVTVVNPGLERTARRTVRVAGDRVVAVEESAAAGVDRRFAGMFVLPGLIDMHVHQPGATAPRDVRLFGILFLAHGVTAVRDAGCFDDSMWERRRRILSGGEPGPRLFACGPILDGDPPIWPGSRVVASPEEARIAVDEVVSAGADCIKVYDKLDAATLAAIRVAAAAHRRPVIGHVPRAVAFEDARLADVQHLTGVALFPDRTGTLAEGWSRVDDARIDTIVRVSREQGVAHTPTLVVWRHFAATRASLLELPSARLLPRYYRDLVWAQFDDTIFRGIGEALPRMDRIVRRLHEAGIRIHAGSDTLNRFIVPGAGLHEELHLLVGAGLSPEEAWVAATRDAGASLGQPGLGTVAADAPADLLVFRADPTRDLANLATLEAVVAQGRLYPRATLDAAVTRARAMFDGPVADAVSIATTRLFMAMLPKPEE